MKELRSRIEPVNQGLTIVSLLWLLAWCLSCAPGRAAEDQVSFRFNPPSGITVVETARTTRIRDFGALGKVTERREMKERDVIAKVGDGYRSTDVVFSSRLTRDGKATWDPVGSALLNVRLVGELDVNGRLLKIRGNQVFLKRLGRLFRSRGQELPGSLNVQSLENYARIDWNLKVGRFVGRTAKMGEVWISQEDYPESALGAGRVYATTKFVSYVKCDGRNCVKIDFRYDSDASVLAKSLGMTPDDFLAAIGSRRHADTAGGIRIVAAGSRLIDPSTMLIYSEQVKRTIEMPRDMPGQRRVTATLQETIVYSFDYKR